MSDNLYLLKAKYEIYVNRTLSLDITIASEGSSSAQQYKYGRSGDEYM